MIKIWRQMASALLVCVLAFSAVFNVSATEGGKAAQGTSDSGTEMTEEEKKAQAELDAAFAIPSESNAWEGWPEGPGTYGEAAIVMEVGTGTILYAKNIDAKMYPASITKVLTALLALEYGNFSDTVTFSHDCVSFLQFGDSSIGLKEGNVITLEQALYATLLASANEAAYAVGENVGKNAGHDYQWFIEQMNAKVQELGGVNSHFVNTNGLHDAEHYTCARDMALIGRALFQHPEVFQIMQTLQYMIPASDTVEEHVFQQKDKMLQPQNANYYPYAIGGKTGYTSDAKSTLITMADNGEMQLVAVVLRTYGKNVYPDTTGLLKYAFENFEKLPVAGNETSEDVAEILPMSSAKESETTEETGASVASIDGQEVGISIKGGESNNDAKPEDSGADAAGADSAEDTDGGESYVVVPKGTAFSDLQMTLTPIGDGTSGEAMLSYTYGGQMVGCARAKMSESYMAANGLVSAEDSEPYGPGEDSESNGEESGISAGLKHWILNRLSRKSIKEKLVMGALCVLLVALIVVYIRIRVIRWRKRRRRR